MALRFSLKRAISGFTTVALAVGLGASLGALPANAAMPDELNLTVHYQRTDGDYTDWDVFLWKNMKSGSDGSAPSCTFKTLDEYGAVAVCPAVTGMANYDDLGIIIRKGGSGWAGKDPAMDRFIGADFFDTAGKGEVWLKTEDPVIYKTAPVVAPPTPTIVAAAIDDVTKITLTLNVQYQLSGTGDEGFVVSDGTTNYAVSSVTGLNGTGLTNPTGKSSKLSLNLAKAIVLGKKYTVSKDTYGSANAIEGNIYDSQSFADAYTYTGNDLGVTYSKTESKFRVWAPTASAVNIVKYPNSNATLQQATLIAMTADVKGTWVATVAGDQNGMIYDYQVKVAGATNYAVDPYARSVTSFGDHGVVVDLAQTNPDGWSTDVSPAFGSSPTDAIIYELQVRDLSMDANSGISAANKGKFLGLTENNTSTSFSATKTVKVGKKTKKVTTNYSTPTGVAAIKDLGVTHVQLLPVYDFASGGDEKNPIFNWGYDPKNYNAPEGGFASDPENPVARIKELKQAIQNLHGNGLRTIMDVVYNHVYDAYGFSQEAIVPGYFFRHQADGSLTSGLGVGNEVASDRPMVSKFIVDSAAYWAKEYHFDGFRFDLMGSLDVTTMNNIRAAVDKLDKNFILLGEGWSLGSSKDPANQTQAAKMPGIAHFNDQIRDGVKGSVFDHGDKGYVSGKPDALVDVMSGIVGNIDYPGTAPKWTTLSPGQSVNYVEAHDNLTLYDKLKASLSKPTAANIVAADRQAAAIIFTSQGLPFMQAGQEFLRSKQGNDNSYNASDAVNSLKWKQRALNASTVSYYKGLISLRKSHPAFRLSTAAAVKQRLKFMTTNNAGAISFTIDGSGLEGETWSSIYVGHNPTGKSYTFKLPSNGWQVVVTDKVAGVTTVKTVTGNSIAVAANSTVVLHK